MFTRIWLAFLLIALPAVGFADPAAPGAGASCGFWLGLLNRARDVVTAVVARKPPAPRPVAARPRPVSHLTVGEILPTFLRYVRNPFQVFQHFLKGEPIRVFRFPGMNDIVFVGDYQLARKLLVNADKLDLERDPVATAGGSRAYGQETPFVGGHPDIHEKARQYAQAAFTPRAVYTPEMAGNMAEAAHRLMDQIRSHLAGSNGDRPVDIIQDMKGAALYAMLRGVFGYEAGEKEIKEKVWPDFAQINGSVLLESILSTSGVNFSKLPQILPVQRRIGRASRDVDALVDKILENARRPDAPRDFLFYDLVRDPQVPPEYLRSIIKTTVAGAMETSASYVTWAIDSLARHPAAAAELRQEVIGVAGNGPITIDQIKRMPKLAAFIKESGRMYSPFYITPRRLEEDVTVETKDNGPVTLRKGSQIWVSLYQANHDPQAWKIPGTLPPDQFDPTRFLDRGPGAPRPPEPMTFGMGKHKCLGIHLAHLEAMILTAELLRNFEMAPGNSRPPAIASGLTTKPQNGLVLRFRDLNPPR